MAHTETGIYLQNMYSVMAQNLRLQSINSYHTITPQNIDHLVEMEMKRLKASYIGEEERYVEQMLRENPIVVERRSQSENSSSSSGVNSSGNVDTKQLQQQRAESCRKSRMNNKIKKAKSKYRHKFVSKKLAQSANVLECIRDVIKQAEAQLLCRGYSQEMLLKLRSTYGLQHASVTHNPSTMAAITQAAASTAVELE